jgi:hypothetical protein
VFDKLLVYLCVNPMELLLSPVQFSELHQAIQQNLALKSRRVVRPVSGSVSVQLTPCHYNPSHIASFKIPCLLDPDAICGMELRRASIALVHCV